uniref:WD repeat-containing protein on Y chromosome n=1 Tax=Varanus komodoensis TaxID=61221 RepID=A0A8D2L2L8_VARKO
MKMAEMCDEARAKQVEEQINYDHLQKLEHMFHEADIDGGGGLDMEEFRKAMKKIMGDISDEDIDVIFMKVDTNCDGSVDWVTHLLWQPSRLASSPVPCPPRAHAEEIVQIQFFPSQSRGIMEKLRKGAVRSPSGRFLTVSRDGILHYWSDTFKMLRTLDQTKRRHSLKLWVINMLCLPNINLLAIATTDQDIEFFDIGGSKCDRIFSLVDLDGCATAMDYWTDGCRGVFCVGDVKGNILIFTSTDVVMNGLFNILSGAESRPAQRIRCVRGARAHAAPAHLPRSCPRPATCSSPAQALHGDWCQQIMYIPQLNLVASCTPADKTAMALTSLPLSAQIVLRKGILCFDYSSELNILVTGGYEPLIRVWNPYVTSSPITHMKGHATAVTHIMINEQRNTIVSISKDKNIRVWDLLDHFCVQSIHGRNVPLGNFPISAAFYHQASNLLVCATYTGVGLTQETAPESWGRRHAPRGATPGMHWCPMLVFPAASPQAVSGCYSGIISVWDIMTGQKMMEFFTSRENPVEITAMAFDTPERRLITALKNESIKLWNFNNGACLMELPFEGRNEISCILYLNHKIYVSGWSKRVTCYLDTKDEHKLVDCKHWKTYHSDDILSMDSYRGKLLVTASCNGDIVLWNVSSGQAFCRFNASESPLVLLPKRVRSASLRAALPRKRPGVQRRRARPEQGRASLWSSASPALELTRRARAGRSAGPSRGRRCPRGARPCPGPPVRPRRTAGGRRLPCPGAGTCRPRYSVRRRAEVLFLSTCERGPHTAILLTSCADGYIYAWAVGSKGGMMGKFHGAHGRARDAVVVCTMSTDDSELVLFTGDSLGYIKIWDIMNYCTTAEEKDSVLDVSSEAPRERRPPFLCPPATFRPEWDGLLLLQVHGGRVTSLVPPVCLSSWRGHLKNVVSIKYVERFRVILTSSHDCTIKLWMLSGRHVGQSHAVGRGSVVKWVECQPGTRESRVRLGAGAAGRPSPWARGALGREHRRRGARGLPVPGREPAAAFPRPAAATVLSPATEAPVASPPDRGSPLSRPSVSPLALRCCPCGGAGLPLPARPPLSRRGNSWQGGPVAAGDTRPRRVEGACPLLTGGGRRGLALYPQPQRAGRPARPLFHGRAGAPSSGRASKCGAGPGRGPVAASWALWGLLPRCQGLQWGWRGRWPCPGSRACGCGRARSV